MAWQNENLANLPRTNNDRRVAAAAHLSFLVGFLTLPALLSVGCRSTHVRRHAAAAANFHAAFAALWMVLLFSFVGLIVVSDTFSETVPALALVPIMAMVFLAGFGLSIAGAVQAWRGNSFRYPVRLPIFGRQAALAY